MVTPTVARNDSIPLLVRMAVVHAAGVAVVIAVPLAVILVVVTGSALMALVAVVIGVAAGAAATAWRMRDLDRRLAERFGATVIEARVHPRLESIVDSTAMAAGIERPIVHIIDSQAVNALSWGAGNGPKCIAVTAGLLETVDRVELEAVMAHQATVISDRPVEAVTLGAALFGGLASGFLGATVARLISTASDPRSVVLSDIDGATATRYPPGMTKALETVADSDSLVGSIPVAFTGLCFAAPAPDPGPYAMHPPIADRIDLMREW